MKNLLIRDLDENTVNTLKARAKENSQSLNSEIKDILKKSAMVYSKPEAIDMVNEIYSNYVAKSKSFSDSSEDISKLRDER